MGPLVGAPFFLHHGAVRSCLIALILGVCAVPAWPAAQAGQAGAYLRAGVGARAAAMGDAAVALAEGPDAGYWNPAALALARRPAIASSLSVLSLGRQYNTAALLLSWDPNDPPEPGSFSLAQRSGLGSWGFTWLGFSLGDDFEGRQSDSASYYRFSDRQSAYLFSHGRPLTRWLAVGASLKLYDRVLETYTASGFGLDVGALILLGPSVRLGLSGGDLFSRLRWSTGYEERMPVLLRSSLSAELWRRLRLAAQLSAVEGQSWTPGLGLEWEAFKGVLGRAGWQTDGFTVGAGLRLPLKTLQLQLDYAFLPDPLQQGATQRFEIDINF